MSAYFLAAVRGETSMVEPFAADKVELDGVNGGTATLSCLLRVVRSAHHIEGCDAFAA